MSGDLDLTSDSGRIPFLRSLSGGRGRRLVGGLQFARQDLKHLRRGWWRRGSSVNVQIRSSFPTKQLEDSGSQSEAQGSQRRWSMRAAGIVICGKNQWRAGQCSRCCNEESIQCSGTHMNVEEHEGGPKSFDLCVLSRRAQG